MLRSKTIVRIRMSVIMQIEKKHNVYKPNWKNRVHTKQIHTNQVERIVFDSIFRAFFYKVRYLFLNSKQSSDVHDLLYRTYFQSNFLHQLQKNHAHINEVKRTQHLVLSRSKRFSFSNLVTYQLDPCFPTFFS